MTCACLSIRYTQSGTSVAVMTTVSKHKLRWQGLQRLSLNHSTAVWMAPRRQLCPVQSKMHKAHTCMLAGEADNHRSGLWSKMQMQINSRQGRSVVNVSMLSQAASYQSRLCVSESYGLTVEKVSWGVQVTRLWPNMSPGPGSLSCLLLWANCAAELAYKRQQQQWAIWSDK